MADCYVNDTPIGPRNNPAWLHITWGDKTGFMTDYHSSSRWSSGNTLHDQGLPFCGEVQMQTSLRQDDPITEIPRSVFYSPLAPATGLRDVKSVADINKKVSEWSAGDCSSAKAVKGIPDTVDTLAGWSKGRLGPVYFLSEANEQQRKQIDNIILLDPGAKSDMARNRVAEIRGRITCDWRYNPSRVLADWLKADDSNRLTIVMGSDTEMKEDSSDPKSQSTFVGLWEFYLADSWDQPFADRITICDYEGMSHEAIMRNFGDMIKKRNMGCSALRGYKLMQWHP